MEKIKQGRGIVGMREGEICNFNSLWSENASLRKGHLSKDLKGENKTCRNLGEESSRSGTANAKILRTGRPSLFKK